MAYLLNMARDGRYHDDVPVPLGQVRALIADFETERVNWQAKKPVIQSNSPLLFIAPGSPVPEQLLGSMDSFDLDTLLQMDECDVVLGGLEGDAQPTQSVNYSKLFISNHVKISVLSAQKGDTFERMYDSNKRLLDLVNFTQTMSVCDSNKVLFSEPSVLQMKCTDKVASGGRASDEHTRWAAELQFFCRLIHSVYGTPMLSLWQLMCIMLDRRCINEACNSRSAPYAGMWLCPGCNVKKQFAGKSWEQGLSGFMQLPADMRFRHIAPI